jgi:hypothetical protein
MAHEWEEETKTTATFAHDPVRVCRICGARQTRYTEHVWMRVRGYRWLPLVGRCKPADKELSR